MFFDKSAYLLVLCSSWFFLSLLGCKSKQKEADYGMPSWQLHMDSDDLGMLNSTVSAKFPVAGELELEGKRYPVRINYAGKSTLDAVKKSFDITFYTKP
jgi:hypothetical protein